MGATFEEVGTVLEETGVELMRRPDDPYLRTAGFGRPEAWLINIANGQTVKRRMGRKIRELGVDASLRRLR